MRRLLGHTMGTPNHTIEEAMQLFERSGLDGVELIVQNDYRSAIPQSDDGTVAKRAKELAKRHNLVIGALTPYGFHLNSTVDAEREQAIADLTRNIDLAAFLGATAIRVYGGGYSTPEAFAQRDRLWDHLITSLKRLAPRARDSGVVLCVENHFSTMTESAAETVELMQAVDHPGVGILYDQANLTSSGNEDAEKAITLQSKWIKHVHVKDMEWKGEKRKVRTTIVTSIKPEDRVHLSRMIGDGIHDWQQIIRLLDEAGYDGYYSLEYEYRWNPHDLLAPEEGFPESTRRLRALGSIDDPIVAE